MVEFEHRRLTPNLNEPDKIARQMAQQFGYTAEVSVPRRLANLLRLRVAQLNPYSYCLILHTRVALESGLDSALVAHLPSWRESDMFDPTEVAALDYCEAVTECDVPRFDTAHRNLAMHFSEPAIADIAAGRGRCQPAAAPVGLDGCQGSSTRPVHVRHRSRHPRDHHHDATGNVVQRR